MAPVHSTPAFQFDDYEQRLARVRLTVHAQYFLIYVSDRLTFFELGVFVTLVQHSALGPLPAAPKAIARRIGVRPLHFYRAWKHVGQFFVLTSAGWILRPNDFISAKAMSIANRVSLRHLFATLVAFWGRACVYCGYRIERLAIEHIVPKARGGSDDINNLTLACQTCNSRKGTKTAAEFGHPHIHERAKGIH